MKRDKQTKNEKETIANSCRPVLSTFFSVNQLINSREYCSCRITGTACRRGSHVVHPFTW